MLSFCKKITDYYYIIMKYKSFNSDLFFAIPQINLNKKVSNSNMCFRHFLTWGAAENLTK